MAEEKPLVRIKYLEYLRVFSMLCVILIHSCITAITDFSEFSYGTTGGFVFYAVRNLCHFAVPIFFMISGTLFLNPDKGITLERLVKRYVLKYVLVIVVFGWGFAFVEEVFRHHKIAFSYLLTSFINMIEGNSWNHMWYLYELVGIMITLPLARVIIHALNDKEQKYLGVICFMFLSAFPMLSHIFNVKIGIRFPLSSVYFFYLLLGYWASKEKITINKAICCVVVFVTVLICVFDAYLYIKKGIEWSLASYSSPFIIALSVAIFILFKNFINNAETAKFDYKIIPFLSKHSFAIYIIHMFWINLIYKALKFNPFEINALLGMIVIWFMVTILSIASAMLMKKIPLLDKII